MDSRQRLFELDTLRGFAALMVVFQHFTLDRPQQEPFWKYGVMGVDLFFMISGFVIFMTISNTKKWQDFVINRFARIYPAYFTALVFTTVLLVLLNIASHSSNNGMLVRFLGNMTMLNHYLHIRNMDNVYWTLLIELQFYGVMLVLYRLKWLNKIVLLGSLGLLFVLINHFLLSQVLNNFFNFSIKVFGLLNHFPLFFAGILFYKLRIEKKVLYYLLIAACYIGQVIIFGNGGTARLLVSQKEYALVLSLFFVVFLLFSNHFSFKFLVNKMSVFFGEISYPLYLTHFVISYSIIIPFFLNKTSWPFWIIVFFIAFPAVVLIASLITFYVEEPVRKYIREKYKGKRN